MKKENNSDSEYRPSLLKAIIRTFGSSYAFLGIFCFFEECVIRVFQPLFMGKIEKYIYLVIKHIQQKLKFQAG